MIVYIVVGRWDNEASEILLVTNNHEFARLQQKTHCTDYDRVFIETWDAALGIETAERDELMSGN